MGLVILLIFIVSFFLVQCSAAGTKGLSGGSACRWYIDEDIHDINSFRKG